MPHDASYPPAEYCEGPATDCVCPLRSITCTEACPSRVKTNIPLQSTRFTFPSAPGRSSQASRHAPANLFRMSVGPLRSCPVEISAVIRTTQIAITFFTRRIVPFNSKSSDKVPVGAYPILPIVCLILFGGQDLCTQAPCWRCAEKDAKKQLRLQAARGGC